MEPQPRQYSPADFLYGPTLGEGRFGTVVYAELKTTSAGHGAAAGDRPQDASSHRRPRPGQQQQRRGYAIKMMTKSEIVRCNQIQAVMTEKYILSEMLSSSTSDNSLLGSELFMKLFLCFHDANYLYLVLELCAGGTLLDLIQSRATDEVKDAGAPLMDISWVRYYACQILRALEYLHQRGVVHRDVTPQNIGLTYPKGELKLGDFGTAAVFVEEHCDGASKLTRFMMGGPSSPGPDNGDEFIGTADYLTPEMIRGSDNEIQYKDQIIFPAMDLWSFGCICYHMFVGRSPFHAASDHLALQRVLDYVYGSELYFPPYITGDARGIISSLLLVCPANRLGMQDGVIQSSMSCNPKNRERASRKSSLKHYVSIRDHSFFQVDKGSTSFFTLVESKSVDPVYRPEVPDWMTRHHRGDTTLKTFESIHYDL